jgi:hypothetical protein
MKHLKLFFGLVVALFFSACGVFRDTLSDTFSEGKYRSKIFNTKKVYAKNNSDSLIVYKLHKVGKEFIADTIKPNVKVFPDKTNTCIAPQVFDCFTLDFDALTIPFKYRFNTKSLPQQFTTSLNGAVYLGFRNDRYKLIYKKHFFNYYQREIRHYAISIGGFTGFGSTAMNPWVTDYAINSEYEGVVWSKGVALIMAIGKFTSGLSIGWDNLLDKNNKSWIYEGKPWVGLVFGLNLN